MEVHPLMLHRTAQQQHAAKQVLLDMALLTEVLLICSHLGVSTPLHNPVHADSLTMQKLCKRTRLPRLHSSVATDVCGLRIESSMKRRWGYLTVLSLAGLALEYPKGKIRPFMTGLGHIPAASQRFRHLLGDTVVLC